MRRRLYFLFPTVNHARQLVNELLLNRISIDNIYVVAKDSTDINNLPQASALQKNDLLHSLFLGILLGAIGGIIAGVIAHHISGASMGGVMIATTLLGTTLGGWGTSIIGLTTPNIQLRKFQANIEAGDLLVMVDVSQDRAEQISTQVQQQHPECRYLGLETAIPV